MDKKEIVRKKVYVELHSGRKYQGIVINLDSDDFVYITDKYGELVVFPVSEIKLLEVEKTA